MTTGKDKEELLFSLYHNLPGAHYLTVRYRTLGIPEIQSTLESIGISPISVCAVMPIPDKPMGSR